MVYLFFLIVSVLFLIGLFAGISSYLILIGLNFIGLSYIIVYIGAVSILFLFILMLINIRISELQSNNKNSIPLALFITIIFNYCIIKILPYNLIIVNNLTNNILNNVSLHNNNYVYNYYKKDNLNINDLIFASSNSWDGNLIETNHISNIGNILYTNYNLWLIITSFILLLSMVGTIVIVKK